MTDRALTTRALRKTRRPSHVVVNLDADDWISTKVRDVINAQMQTFANAVRRGQA